MKEFDGLDPYSATWQGARKMFRAEIESARDALAASGLEQRPADELRGRLSVLNELLALGEKPAPQAGSVSKETPRAGY